MRALFKRLSVPALLAGIIILFFWKLVLTDQYTWLDAPDLANLVLPWFQFQAAEFHKGVFPLWDPYSWLGQPLLGQAQPGSAYPPNWILFGLPLNPQGWIRQVWMHWYYVLIRIAAALCAYALARDLGRSRTAAAFAGLVYALVGYVASADWPQLVNGAVWTPLVFLYLFRAERGERPAASAALSGFWLGFSWLAGHHQVPLYVTFAAGSLWLWFSWKDRRLLRCAALAILVALLVSALQTLPTAEYGRLAVRWSGTDNPLAFSETVPFPVHAKYSLQPFDLIAFVIPAMNTALDPFLGFVALGLASFGILLAWDDRRVRWLALLGAAGLAIAFAPHTPLYGPLYSLLPMLEKARAPGVAILLFHFAIAVLTAYGIDAFQDRKPGSRGPIRTLAAAGLAVLGLSVGAALFKVTLGPGDGRMLLAGLWPLAAAGILAAWRAGSLTRAAATAALAFLFLAEASSSTGFWFKHRSETLRNHLKNLSENVDIVSFLRSSPPGRVEYDRARIPYNLGDWWGLESFGNYTASVPANLWKMPVFDPQGRQLFGVRYYVGDKPIAPDQREIYSSPSGLKVFENPGTLPRAWTVHRVVRDSQPARLFDPTFDPRREAFLPSEPPTLETCDGDTVDLVRHRPNAVEIAAEMRCRGLVILSDNYFPGWRATVDGQPAPIHEAYGSIRGVVVEKGSHTVRMVYRPLSVYAGAGLSLLGCLLTAGFAWRRSGA